jgi:hypothetical protein
MLAMAAVVRATRRAAGDHVLGTHETGLRATWTLNLVWHEIISVPRHAKIFKSEKDLPKACPPALALGLRAPEGAHLPSFHHPATDLGPVECLNGSH